MKKKKRYTFLWFVLNCACWGIAGVLGYDLIYRMQQEPHITYIAPEIPLEHTKYGDYLVGLMAKENHDYAKMTLAFESALSNDPDNIKLKKNVYLLKAIRGDIDAVLPLAKDLNTLRQAELLTDYVLIAEAFHNKSYDTATHLLSDKPAYGADRILKPALNAWIAVGQNDRVKAEKFLAELNTPKSPALYHYYMALVAMAFGDQTAAEKNLKKMNAHSEKGYPSLTALIILRDFFQSKDIWREGMPEYDRYQTLLNGAPQVKEVAKDLTAPKSITPQIGAAIAFYDVSVALAPLKLEETSLIFNALAMYLKADSVAFKFWAGELLEMSGNHQAANRVYQLIPHKNDVISRKMILNFLTIGQYSEAIPILRQMAQQNPNDPSIQMLLGESLFQTQDYSHALQTFTRATDLFQKENQTAGMGRALFMKALIYDKMGNEEQVEKSLLSALRQIPNDPQTLNYLGYLWLDKRKNIDEAFKMVEKAAELDPSDPAIMDSLALGYYLKKDYQKALELAEKSTDLISYSSVAYAHLGDIYAALNRPKEAHYQYRKALDLTTDMTPELKAELEKKLNLTR